MPSDLDAERMWQGFYTRGEFDTVVLPLRQTYQALRLKLDRFLVKKKLTPENWSELQNLQGQMQGVADAIWELTALAKPTAERQPSARPDDLS